MQKESLALSLLMIAAGCGSQVGEEDGGGRGLCGSAKSRQLTATDASPIGFSAQQVLDVVSGQKTAPLGWEGSRTVATVNVTYLGGAIRFHEQALEAARGCDKNLEIPVQIRFVTQDGAFNETWNQAIFAREAGAATTSRALDEVAGTYRIQTFTPPGTWKDIKSSISLRLTDMVAGSITGSAEGRDSASVKTFPVATIGEAAAAVNLD